MIRMWKYIVVVQSVIYFFTQTKPDTIWIIYHRNYSFWISNDETFMVKLHGEVYMYSSYMSMCSFGVSVDLSFSAGEEEVLFESGIATLTVIWIWALS